MRLKALSNIRHNGAQYGTGDTLEATEQEAKALVDAGVAEKVTSKEEKPKQEAKKPEEKKQAGDKKPEAK